MYATPSAAVAAQRYGAAAGESPLANLVEVHEGMIAKLQEARTAIGEGRIEDRFNISRKVASVIDVLQLSLDRTQGGEIAANLDRLYTYFGRRLNDLNVNNDAAICDELIVNLASLRDGWRHLSQGGVPVPEAADVTASASVSA